jgi:oligopeptide/dipeptide ABC transporter ATP-binding protein
MTVASTTQETTTPADGGQPADAGLLLEVQDLRTHFHVMDGVVRAVDGVSFGVGRGRTLGVVGESGCGKSVTAMTVMRLLDIPPARIASGRILFEGRDLLALPEDQMRKLRGNEIAMIFQEPMSSLNPVFNIGTQISEAVRLHFGVDKKEALDRSIEALRLVGIAFPERRVKQYPHEMSGGMRQRVMIAMALACEPKLLIADEPTTALDVTIQAQILDLIRTIQERTQTAVLLITHDLGVVAEMADDVVVMYAGRVVEHGTVSEVLLQPRHPYTEGLLTSIPSKGMRGQRLNVIKGSVPNPFNMPTGCNFAPRCPYRFEPCGELDPRADEGDGPPVACWLWKRAPGYPEPTGLRQAQVAAAARATEASTAEVSALLDTGAGA